MRRTRKSHLWLAGAGAIVAFAVSLSMNGAVLADSKATPPTVETTLGSDGSAVSTRVLNSNGANTSGISGSTALKTSIAYSLNGQPTNRDQLTGARGPVSVTYKVENTTGKTQDVTYTSADGQQHTQQLLIQVPFVAMVEATVPASYNNVQAPGGAVSVGTDGNLHIIWSLVLFSPIGSPTQEVSFSAQADAPTGLPGVTVTARPINPSATEGLSGGTLTANAAVAQNDLFGTYATGADQGLAQLGSGIGQLVAGLTQLHDGSTQLATGLSNPGCNLNNPLNPANPCGIQQGSGALAAGLTQINTGLAQLAAPATGLPSAQVGIGQLQAGVSQLLAGVSNPKCDPALPLNPANPCGVVQGLDALSTGVGLISGGVGLVQGGLGDYGPLDPLNPTVLAGLKASRDGLTGLELGLGPALTGIGPGPGPSRVITGVTASGTTITATLAVASPPGFVGQPITVAGITGFTTNNPNGSFVVTGIIDATHFKYVVPTAPTGTYGSGGTVTAGSEITGLTTVHDNLQALATYYPAGISPAPGSCGAVSCHDALFGLATAIGTSNSSPPFPWTLIGGLNELSFGLSHTAGSLGPTDPGGAVQVLDLINTGPTSGLGKVVLGLDGIKQGLGAVQGGLSNPAPGCNPASPPAQVNPCGLTQGLATIKSGVTGGLLPGLSNPACNPCGVREGLALLANGTTTAVNGINQLYAGSGQALTGAKNLAAGAPTAASGAQQIRDGLASALSGAQQAGQGTSAISAQGTAPLITQLQDASNNAHLELATIDATGARASGAPLGADATWLYRLDAVAPSGANNLGRNLALAVGGLLLLLLCGVGGFVFGRRGRAGAVA